MDMDTATAPRTAPLEGFAIIGFTTKTFRAAPDAPAQSGESCWHCGAGITNCVVVRNRDTGEVVDIGTTCAERVGLDSGALKAMLREKFAEQRNAAAAASATARRKADEEREMELAGTIGAHGTPERYTFGCYCGECRLAAPHGTAPKFYDDECRCSACVDFAFGDGLVVVPMLALLDAKTGERMNARLVDGHYGRTFVMDGPDGAIWIKPSPKRRATMVNKGYVQIEENWLGRAGRNGFYPIVRTSSAIADVWGEPTPGR